MPATYSINPGTPQEALSYNQVSDILNLIPDNASNLISPRDIRDSVFSNWETSVFRYTNSGTYSYIGIDRSNIKDKIFFGKKELSGNSILDSILLSSDTDIFFFNTKTDANPSQDLKISFIGGGSSSLYPYAPYLEVVNNLSGTPSLDLNIGHNQPFGGDINIQAGNYGRISLNGFTLPSSTEATNMVASPTSSSPSDLFLVRTSGGYLELRSPSSLSSIIGDTLTPTNIYGSPVYINGYDMEFSDSNATPVDIGGILAGTTFSSVPVTEMIRSLLYPYLGPLCDIYFSSYVEERVHVGSLPINFGYDLTKRTSDITSSTIEIEGNSLLYSGSGPLLSGPGFITQTYSDVFTFSGVDILANDIGIFTFSISDSDGTQSFTASAELKFVYPYFYGFSATTSNIQTIVNNDLTKMVNDYASQSVSLAGTGYIHYCFDNSYGDLSEIYDGNGFLLWQYGTSSTSWTYSVSSIDSPDTFWSGASYSIYRTTDEVTIPLPSQNYKFNF